ncbi:MAG TPA: RluA family pseudouridine synthase [Candidatus Saccharibacteria bacterium]|nr:RluA family pseudouridine synthase [Candidatus Saccharibacteria bacterium]
MQKIIVDAENSERLDLFLVGMIPELSRSSIQKLCDSGKVLVNNEQKPTKYKVKMGDEIKVYFDPKELDEIPKIDLPVLYEDEDCIVIDKPSGILTHSKGSFNPEATVATFIRDKISDIDSERAGIVHRLDRGTSGVIICAKNQKSLDYLQKQFADRKTVKKYIAIIEGTIEPSKAIIDMPIARDVRNPKSFCVKTNGKESITAYELQQQSSHYSLLVLTPKTGRTHQLRVHLSHQKHPIVGDELYGGKPFSRILLHAKELTISLPEGKTTTFESKLPAEFIDIMNV